MTQTESETIRCPEASEWPRSAPSEAPSGDKEYPVICAVTGKKIKTSSREAQFSISREAILERLYDELESEECRLTKLKE